MRITTCLALLLCFSASYATAQEPSPVDVTTETQSDEQWRSHIDRARTAYEAADGAAMDSAVQAALGIAQSDFADDDSRLALTHIYIGIAQLLNGRHAEAEPPLRLALSIYDETGGRERLEAVAAISALAEARIAQGDMTEAEELLIDGVATARRLGSDGHADTVHIASVYGQLLSDASRFTEAETLVLPVRDAARTALGKTNRHTIQIGNVIGALWLAQGRFDDAIAELTTTQFESEAALGVDHPVTLGVITTLARSLVEAGRPLRAEPLLRRAIAGGGQRPGINLADYLLSEIQLSKLLCDKGSFVEAEQLAKSAVNQSEQNYSTDHPVYLSALENLGQLYAAQRRTDAALPIIRRAVETRQRVQGVDARATRNAQMMMFDLLLSTGQIAEAEPILNDLTEASRQSEGAEHPNSILLAIRHAELQVQNEMWTEAAAAYHAIIPVAERILGPEHISTLSAKYGLAALLSKQDGAEAGERLYTEVWLAAVAARGEDHPSSLLYATALTNARLHMPARAADAVEPAQMIARVLRNRRLEDVGNEFARTIANRAINQTAPSLTLVADALFAARQAKDTTSVALAFDALQSATAGAADQAVLRTTARQVADAQSSRLGTLVRNREELEKAVQSNADAYDSALAESGDEATLRRTELGRIGDQIGDQLSAIDNEIREAFPDYFSLIRPEAIDTASIQSVLADDEAILMLVPTDFGTHVVAISRTDSVWQRAPVTQGDVGQSVRRLLYDVGAPVDVAIDEQALWQEEGGRGYPFSRRTAWALYRNLIEPMTSILRGKRHVFIAAYGALTSLPLGMLVTEEPVGADGDANTLRATHWLADEYALIQIPSIQSLYLQRRARAIEQVTDTANVSFAGFGDPLLDGIATSRGGGRGATRGNAATVADLMSQVQGDHDDRFADPLAIRRLARLPGTAIELNNLRNALGAPDDSVRLGAAATESAVRSADLAHTSILALATHGLLAGELGGSLEPGLIFTPPTKASGADDGLLTASEIASLNLDADWVILSACNTAAGDGSEGAQGLSGLAQAFFFAGAQTLLASHWLVRDEVASRISVRTVEIQRDNPQLSRAESFQRAMREIREDASHDTVTDTWAHPNAWAPFTLIGDGAR